GGEVEQPDPAEPLAFKLLRSEPDAGAALRGHRPLAARPDHDGDHASRLFAVDGAYVNAARGQLGDEPVSGIVAPDPTDEPGRLAQRRRPGAEVRGLAAAAEPDRGRR